MSAERPELRVVAVRRQSSRAAAVAAGLQCAAGDYVVTLAGDVRQDSADALRLLQTLHWGDGWGAAAGRGRGEKEEGKGDEGRGGGEREGGGYDVVCGWRRGRRGGSDALLAVTNLLVRLVTGVSEDTHCVLLSARLHHHHG